VVRVFGLQAGSLEGLLSVLNALAGHGTSRSGFMP